MVAMAIVIFIDFLDDTIRDPMELSEVGYSTTGIIATFKSEDGNELITDKQPRAPSSESYLLCVPIYNCQYFSPNPYIAFHQSIPGDGKTSVAMNLACVVSQGVVVY